jgi:FtsH-binding integral membrane protein
MTYDNCSSFKKASIRKLESVWFLLSVLLLISSVMCAAVAFLALVMPGVHSQMLGFILASLILGFIGKLSLHYFKKRSNQTTRLWV